MEEELFRLRLAKDDLQMRVSLQNTLIEQQQEHIDLLKKHNQAQEQQIAILTREGKAWQDRSGKNGHSAYPSPSSHPLTRQPAGLRFPSRPVAVILIVLVLCLLGAGTIGIYGAATDHLPWQGNTPHGSSTTVSLASTALVNATTPPALSSGPSQVTIPGLFTISGGMGLSHYFLSSEGICTNFALATDRLMYTSAELQKMYNFFNNNMHRVPPPETLKAVDGGSTTPGSGLSLPQVQGCPTIWEMTNTGQKSIQLVQLRMKLLVNSREADKQYRLVDYCSIIEQFEKVDGPCPGLGGQGQPVSYTFSFGPGKAGSFIQGQSTVGEPVIDPGQTIFLQLSFVPASLSAALVYTIEPEFVINTSNETGKIIDVPQWKETFVMAPVDHFSCYALQGNTFVTIGSHSPTSCI
ncbi:MAG: hypothetical protein ACRDIV_17865 [Ktedonobacteraceae bacterium]